MRDIQQGTDHNNVVLKVMLEKGWTQNFNFKGTEAEGLIGDMMDITAGRGTFQDRLIEFTALADSI